MKTLTIPIKEILPNETILENDVPVYWDYLYIADNNIVRSDIIGTVADLRKDLESQNISAKIIRCCDIFGRKNKI